MCKILLYKHLYWMRNNERKGGENCDEMQTMLHVSRHRKHDITENRVWHVMSYCVQVHASCPPMSRKSLYIVQPIMLISI